MGKAETSPFTPGSPVNAALFQGRGGEVQRINRQLAEALQRKRLEVFFLAGERGIGKTSLARLIRTIAERDYGFAGVHVFLGGATSVEEVVRRVFDSFVRIANERRGIWERTKDFFVDRVENVGAYGLTVQFKPKGSELEEISHNFYPTLANLHARLEPEIKGFLVVLDDINGLSKSENFANFLKSFIDHAAMGDSPFPMTLVLCGLPERREDLLSRQPSLDRVLEVIEVKPLPDDEVSEFMSKAFSSAGVSIQKDALKFLTDMTGGWPVFMHEIGDATFYADSDGHIDEDDSYTGVAAAAENVGRKFLERQVYEAIRSQKYRSMLRKICQMEFGAEIRRKDVATLLTTEEKKVLDNFLNKMRELNVLKQGSTAGSYKFTKDLYQLYMLLESWDAERESQKKAAKNLTPPNPKS